jgi:hypothetical protein
MKAMSDSQKTRIEELEKKIAQDTVELSYYNGSKIEYKHRGWMQWEDYDGSHPTFEWREFTYRIKEEPKRIPFDGSDAIRLMKRIFREQNEDICYSPVYAGKDVINLGFESFTYEELIINKIEIWNEEKEVWESCSKPF